jgi:hypothetical protein
MLRQSRYTRLNAMWPRCTRTAPSLCSSEKTASRKDHGTATSWKEYERQCGLPGPQGDLIEADTRPRRTRLPRAACRQRPEFVLHAALRPPAGRATDRSGRPCVAGALVSRLRPAGMTGFDESYHLRRGYIYYRAISNIKHGHSADSFKSNLSNSWVSSGSKTIPVWTYSTNNDLLKTHKISPDFSQAIGKRPSSVA